MEVDTRQTTATLPPNDPQPVQPPQPATLIVTGKRSRRKVNKSADYLFDAPVRVSRTKHAHAHNDHDGMDIVGDGSEHQSPASMRRRRKTANSKRDANVVAEEIAAKRARLQQRRIELEAYLKRLQVALAVEQNNVPVASSGAAAKPSGSNGGVSNRDSTFASNRSASSNARRRSVLAKKKEVKPVVSVVDDDAIQPSLKTCIAIIDDLINNRYGDVFSAPVDWQALNLPTYPDIVKNPMDLGTIRSRLTSNSYQTLTAFINDVQLVWDNAKLFNAPKSFVHDATINLETIWNRKKDNLKRERRRSLQQAANVRDLASPSDLPAPSMVQSAANESSKQLTFLEKSKLRADIVRVPKDQIEEILNIARGSAVSQSSSNDQLEVELNIEMMSTETLRELQKFVASVLPKTTQRHRTSAGGVRRKLSNSMTSVATVAVPSESDSDSSSSSGLDSESSDDEAVPPLAAPLPPHQVAPPPENVAPPVEVVNTDAWSNLEDGGEGQEATEQQDPLWTDYQTMSAEAIQRDKERREQEEARRIEKERFEAEQAEQAEKARIEKELSEQRLAQEAAEREEQRARQLEEEREAARRALEHDTENEEDHSDSLGFLTTIFRS